VGGILYALLSPWVGSLLSGGQLQISYGVAISLGTALSAMLISQVTGFTLLTTYRKSQALAWSTVAGAAVGALALIPAALWIGLSGVTSVLALSEVVVLGFQVFVVRMTLNIAQR
jgi:hypothetical protein